MADTKTSALTALTGASVDTATDVLPIVDTSVTTTKKILVSELAIALGASGGTFTTGDVKLTFKTTADASWVLMNDTTIGNAASGGTGRANADTVDLFTLLWNNTADADCAVSTGRGASAAADYAANKTIALPKALGRSLAIYGSGSGLTARALAKIVGVETHPLVTAELAAHTHTLSSGAVDSQGAHTHTVSSGTTGYGAPGSEVGAGGALRLDPIVIDSGGAHTHNVSALSLNNAGSGTAHQNMQPTVFLNVMIKL